MQAEQTRNADAAAIKVAIIGYGLAGRVFHAPFVNAVPGLRLSYIVQRQGNTAVEAYPDATILRSVDEAIASDAQMVVVGSPNATHYAFAKSCLEAGKHVVIDKPFCATSEEARQLIKIAAERSLVLAPFHNRRWDGDFLTVKKLLSEEAVGRLVTYMARWDRFSPTPKKNTWKETGDAANGLLLDLGSHLVDQALSLFGLPLKITASIRTERDGSMIDDAFDLVLHYPRLLASCHSTMLACDASPRFLLHGTKGSFKKYGLDPQEPALVGGRRVPPLGSGHDWLREDESQWGALTQAVDAGDPKQLTRQKIETFAGDYRQFYANVRDAIRGAAPLAVTAEDAWRLLRVLELARESSELGRTMPVQLNT
jgi:scyllo-inositol 2-dehydrogenase (NADP+)